MRQKDRQILLDVMKDVAQVFGLETVDELDGALTMIYGTDATGDRGLLAEIGAPRR